MKLKNKYYIMRHGQAISNVKAICSCWPEKFKNPLTKLGRTAVKESAKKLKKKLNLNGQTIDLIFDSPMLRTKQTAKIVADIFKAKPKTDRRLREIGFGKFNGKKLESMWKSFKHEEDRIKKGVPKGESYQQILDRMMEVVKDIEKKYKSKNVMLISSEGPLFLLQGKIMGLSLKQTIEKFTLDKRIHKAEIRELN